MPKAKRDPNGFICIDLSVGVNKSGRNNRERGYSNVNSKFNKNNNNNNNDNNRDNNNNNYNDDRRSTSDHQGNRGYEDDRRGNNDRDRSSRSGGGGESKTWMTERSIMASEDDGGGRGGGRRYSDGDRYYKNSKDRDRDRDHDDYYYYDRDRDRGRVRSNSRGGGDDYYGRRERGRDDDYDDKFGRSSSSNRKDEFGRSSYNDDERKSSRGDSMDEFGRSSSSNNNNKDDNRRRSADDYYGGNRDYNDSRDGSRRGGGGGERDRRRRDDDYDDYDDYDRYRRSRHRSNSPYRGEGRANRGRGYSEDDWKRKEYARGGSASSSSASEDEMEEGEAGGNSSRGRRRQQRRKKKLKKNDNDDQEWPPCFEDNGDAFVFDSRSGMFYESGSDFFYDPTSKLYYGNKKLAYFSYDAVKKQFVPVDSKATIGVAPPAGSAGAANHGTEQDHLMLVPNGAANSKNNKEQAGADKKMIAINLKTAAAAKPENKKRKKRWEGSGSGDTPSKKEKQSSTTTTTNTTEQPASKLQKQYGVNMDMWQVRKQEVKIEDGNNKEADADAAKQPLVTNRGKPICWVCKRKFANKEKLQLHEEKSKLHAENLAKQKQKEQELTAATAAAAAAATARLMKPVAEYVDRAQQRRDMYGPDLVLPPAPTTITPSVSVAGAGAEKAPGLSPPAAGVGSDRPRLLDNPTPATAATNNDGNIGAKMMEKLGWKSGETLGRGTEQQQEQQAKLSKDWDRIESLAAQNNNKAPQRRPLPR